MKKFVTSLLAMVMLLSLCTGCGGQKDSSSTGDTALLQVPLPLRLWFCVWPTATTLSTSPARPARCSLIW